MSVGSAIALGGAAGLFVLWLGWRRPNELLAIVVASFAIGPQWILAGHLRGGLALAAPLQKALLVAAIAAQAWRFGARRGITNWPLLAVVFLALQGLLLADLEPRLTLPVMAFAALDLALPFTLVHLVVAPGSRARYALLLASLALGCVASGVALHLIQVHEAYYFTASRGLRLQGANNAGWLACLAFAGFAVALHEAVQRHHVGFAVLAAGNLLIAVLTSGRMGVGACLVLAVAYLGSAALNARASIDRRATLAFGIGGALGLGLLGAALVQGFGIDHVNAAFSLTARESIWASHFAAFLESPIFGRGLGAAALGANYYDLPHNEYLRLLVEGGVVGFVVYGAAVTLWGRRILALVAPGERGFVRALFLALAVYALTDNVLTMIPALVPFLYLPLILGEPAPRRPHVAKGASAEPRSVSDGPHATPAPGLWPRRPGPGSETPR